MSAWSPACTCHYEGRRCMHAHRSSYPRISSVPLIRISHLAPTPPGLSCGSGRAQPSGAGLWRGDLVRGWCGTLAYTSCPGLSGAHFKRVVKACFDPPSASAVFSTYLPRFLLLHVVSCIAFERIVCCLPAFNVCDRWPMRVCASPPCVLFWV